MLSQPIPLPRAFSPQLLRCYGRAACGFPSPAQEFEEPPLSLDDLCEIGSPSLFLLIASGDSMTGLGIYDGDILIVDKAKEATKGKVVVARIGADFTVKIFTMIDDKPALKAANPAYKTIFVGEDEDAEIWGVVQWNLHRL
jgi:DNA polymerase V